MPTNLPPEYSEAEKRYRAATTIPEKISTLEDLISTIPKHKGTDKLRAGYRRRLSKLKTSAQSQKKAGSQRASVYSIEKEGAGRVVVIGPGNTGKSALVANLTGADPEVSEAPFTTWQPIPGMMSFENVQIQLIDTPSLDRGFFEPEFIQMIQGADLILLVLDLQADPIQQFKDAITMLQEHRIVPEHMEAQGSGMRLNIIPTLVLVNKNDDESSDEDVEIFCELLGEEDCPLLPVSAMNGRNLEVVKQEVFEKLEVIRIYSKAPGKEPDLSSPFVLRKGSTIDDFARKVHKDFYDNLKTARIWGEGADFDGQMVSRDQVLQDGTVVELKTK